MDLTILTTLEAWDELVPEWDALLTQSVNPSPFLAPYYLKLWWQSAGGGEWSAFERELCIITARDNGRLVCIAPLFRWRDASGKEQIGFIGQVEVSDYLDFIVHETDLDNFLSALLNFFTFSEQLKNIDLFLANILTTSPSLPAIEKIAKAQNWSAESKVLEVAPYIPLAESFEAYLSQIDKKQRHEIRRKMRRAQEQAEIRLHFVQPEDDFGENIRAFLTLMEQDSGKATFLTQDMRAFFKAFSKAAFEQGDLVFSWLLINGQRSAGYLSLKKNNNLYVYNSCWDTRFMSYSPGWVHLAMLIEWAIEQGLHEVDMMRGDEIYKYRFGGIDRQVLEIHLKPPK